MRRFGRAAVLLLLVALLGGAQTVASAVALAQPSPPPNPSDEDLRRSRDSVAQRAGEVGGLTTRLAELDSRTDDLQAALAGQREVAEGALVDLDNARGAAAAATARADAARIETEAATAAIDQARERLDEFVAATYQQGIDSGPLGLLTEATSPEDLVARAEFNDAIARTQLNAQDGLERARVDKANADSTSRAALEDARAREAEAAQAKTVADAAFAAADAAAREQAAQLAAVASERAEVQRRLDAAESRGLRPARPAPSLRRLAAPDGRGAGRPRPGRAACRVGPRRRGWWRAGRARQRGWCSGSSTGPCRRSACSTSGAAAAAAGPPPGSPTGWAPR